MSTINTNKIRIGNFTSSEIYKLTKEGKTKGTLGKPAITYIEEKNTERLFEMPLDSEMYSKPTSWGNFVEQFAFAKLGLDYQLSSQTSVLHNEIDCWAGSADGFKFDEGKTVIDIKCPFTRLRFSQLIKIKTGKELKENFEDYYWQLVSNAILNECKYAELIIYMPYLSDLIEISEAVKNYDGDQKPYEFIFYQMEACPFIKDGSTKIKDLNILRFEVTGADKIFLTEKVKLASKYLIER